MVSVGRSCGCIKQEKDPTPKQKHRPTAKQKCHWLKETELGSNDTKGKKKEKKKRGRLQTRREKFTCWMQRSVREILWVFEHDHAVGSGRHARKLWTLQKAFPADLKDWITYHSLECEEIKWKKKNWFWKYFVSHL